MCARRRRPIRAVFLRCTPRPPSLTRFSTRRICCHTSKRASMNAGTRTAVLSDWIAESAAHPAGHGIVGRPSGNAAAIACLPTRGVREVARPAALGTTEEAPCRQSHCARRSLEELSARRISGIGRGTQSRHRAVALQLCSDLPGAGRPITPASWGPDLIPEFLARTRGPDRPTAQPHRRCARSWGGR